MLGHFTGDGRTFFRHISRPFSRPVFRVNLGDTQTDKHTNCSLYSKTTFIRFCFFSYVILLNLRSRTGRSGSSRWTGTAGPTTSLGCYSLRRSCNLSVVRRLNVESSKYVSTVEPPNYTQSGSITFRRVGFSICVHR